MEAINVTCAIIVPFAEENPYLATLLVATLAASSSYKVRLVLNSLQPVINALAERLGAK